LRDRWYSDKRDVVKWGTLIHLAKKRDLKTILQVAYYIPEESGYQLETSDGTVEFPDVVWKYFRDLNAVSRLGGAANLRIEVFVKPITDRAKSATEKRDVRKDYLESLLERVRTLRGKRLLVFLDPDTGIAPQRWNETHATTDEIQRVLQQLARGDWLVLYQHARREKDWDKRALDQFSDAVGVAKENIETFRAPKARGDKRSALARDVVLFALAKP